MTGSFEDDPTLVSHEPIHLLDEGMLPFVGNAALLADIQRSKEIEISPYVLTRESYDAITAERGIRKAVATRLWNGAVGTISIMHYHTETVLGIKPHRSTPSQKVNVEMDLLELLDAYRTVEAGEIKMGYSFGKTGWNLFAELINTHLGDDQPGVLVLPYDETIHPAFQSISNTQLNTERAQQAALRLEKHYQEADYEAAKLRQQIALF